MSYINDISKLVKQAKQKDSSALAKLYEITYQRIYFLAYSMLDDTNAAQEATQEAYIRIIADLHSLHNGKHFISWADKITYRICCSSEGKQMPSGPDDAAVKAIAKPQRKNAAIKVLFGIEPSLRAASILKYYDKLNTNEISDIMDLSKSEGKLKVKAAEKQLKNQSVRERVSLPFKGLLTQAALGCPMDPLFAHNVIINALAENGLTTNVIFHPQPPSPAIVSSKLGFTIIFSLAGLAAAGALGVALFTPPTISELTVINPPGHFDNESVEITANVSTPLNIIDKVFISDENGKFLNGSLSDDGVMSFTATENGKYDIRAVSKTNRSTSTHVFVTCIDKVIPIVEEYTYSKETMSITVMDELSGIDYNGIYGEGISGERIYPISTNPATGTVDFNFPKENLTLYIGDLAGNISTHQVSLFKESSKD